MTLALLLMTPLVWFIIYSYLAFKFEKTNKEESRFGAAMLVATFITLFLWGLFLAVGR